MVPPNLQVVDGEATMKPRAPRKPRAPKAKTVAQAVKRALTPSRVFMAAVALVALTVSLSDLAEGVAILADVPAWKAWSMALVFDLFLIADEYLLLTAEMPRDARAAAEALMGLVVMWSMYLNALAFSHGQFDVAHVTQIGMGICLPLAIALATFAASRSK